MKADSFYTVEDFVSEAYISQKDKSGLSVVEVFRLQSSAQVRYMEKKMQD